MPKARNYWFKTYYNYYIDKLLIRQSTYDPCLLYSNQPFSVVGIQTDDTLILGDYDFIDKEQAQLQKASFLAKDREQLSIENDLKFNGGVIQLQDDGSITLTQERQCKNLKLVSTKTIDSTSSRGITRKELLTKEQYVA